jgi:hypothetical protein
VPRATPHPHAGLVRQRQFRCDSLPHRRSSFRSLDVEATCAPPYHRRVSDSLFQESEESQHHPVGNQFYAEAHPERLAADPTC